MRLQSEALKADGRGVIPGNGVWAVVRSEPDAVQIIAVQLIEIDKQVRDPQFKIPLSQGLRPLDEHRPERTRYALEQLGLGVVAKGQTWRHGDSREVCGLGHKLFDQQSQSR